MPIIKEKLNGLHSDHLLKKEMSQYVKDKTLLVNMHVFEGYKSLRNEFYLGTLYGLAYCTVNAITVQMHAVTVEGI